MKSVVEEVAGPAVALRTRDGVPCLRVFGNRFVPAPVLNKTGRSAEQVEIAVQCGDGLGYGEGESFRPRMKNVVEHPVLVEAAHSRKGTQVGAEERDQRVEEPATVGKAEAENRLQYSPTGLGKQAGRAHSSDHQHAFRIRE